MRGKKWKKLNNIKLIITDLDGTVLEHGKICSTDDLDAFQEAIDNNIHVTIATGQGYSGCVINSDKLGEFMELKEIFQDHQKLDGKELALIARVRSVASFAFHKFFTENDFVYLQTPIITSNDAEGAGEQFVVTTNDCKNYDEDFFGKKATLTVSGQLNAEALAQAFKKTYTFGPTFRAENSFTSRHADAEFE
ncbi:hypothetical protein FQA39_LY12958 [Lamprigera yunnana]|nr:hypothetical protein FQA39_LY12958 [Lamprigera yunnana]